MRYFIIVNDKLVVSLVENEEVAETLMGDNGFSLGQVEVIKEQDVKKIEDLLQSAVDGTLQYLDRKCQQLPADALNKPDKNLN